MDVAKRAAILWNHRTGNWSYNPSLVVRFLDDYRNIDRYEEVERSVIEGLVEQITGGRPLPDEGVIRRMLEKGTNQHG
ncbi:hypothetical protein [Micromonospora deserti]|uniref:hypothetical protein n=1 Tax=Micromonospora deserti TaxID=2070366 RepID=UPI0011B51A62|nr:hypothetical protein [Micromonospora deserti]